LKDFVVAVDLDGTLCWNERRDEAIKKLLVGGDWHGSAEDITAVMKSHSCLEDEATHIKHAVKMLARLGAQIYYVTARLENLRGETTSWLRSHGMPECMRPCRLIMRPVSHLPGNEQESNAVYKTRVCKKIGAHAIIDDDPKILAAVRKAGIAVIHPGEVL
jgi:hypothetical protein